MGLWRVMGIVWDRSWGIQICRFFWKKSRFFGHFRRFCIGIDENWRNFGNFVVIFFQNLHSVPGLCWNFPLRPVFIVDSLFRTLRSFGSRNFNFLASFVSGRVIFRCVEKGQNSKNCSWTCPYSSGKWDMMYSRVDHIPKHSARYLDAIGTKTLTFGRNFSWNRLFEVWLSEIRKILDHVRKKIVGWPEVGIFCWKLVEIFPKSYRSFPVKEIARVDNQMAF